MNHLKYLCGRNAWRVILPRSQYDSPTSRFSGAPHSHPSLLQSVISIKKWSNSVREWLLWRWATVELEMNGPHILERCPVTAISCQPIWIYPVRWGGGSSGWGVQWLELVENDTSHFTRRLQRHHRGCERLNIWMFPVLINYWDANRWISEKPSFLL